jgi:hypothetical protein
VFENDYIMRMILRLVEAIRRSLDKGYTNLEEEEAELERAIGDAVDMDPQLLLSLTPESVVSMLQLGSFDAKLGGYVVRALFYEADLLEEQERFGSADLRRAQAQAIAKAYNIDADIASARPEMLEEFFAAEEAEDAQNLPRADDAPEAHTMQDADGGGAVQDMHNTPQND